MGAGATRPFREWPLTRGEIGAACTSSSTSCSDCSPACSRARFAMSAAVVAAPRSLRRAAQWLRSSQESALTDVTASGLLLARALVAALL